MLDEQISLTRQPFLGSAPPTFYAYAPPVVCAQNKHVLSILNNAGSGQTLRLKKLFLINGQLAAVAGVALQYDVKKISACSGGTVITPLATDSADMPLTAVTALSAPTAVTEGALWFSCFTNNDEVGATGAFFQQTLQAGLNLIPEGLEVKEIALRPGEGATLKQITSSALGLMGALAVLIRD